MTLIVNVGADIVKTRGDGKVPLQIIRERLEADAGNSGLKAIEEFLALQGSE